MPRLTKSSFFNQSDERLERLMFVGTTRATNWVYYSTNDKSFKLLARLAALEGERKVTVQTGPMKATPKPSKATSKAKPKKVTAEDDLGFL